MDLTLVLTAAALGLGGAWHCALMCGSLCGSQPQKAWLLGRTLGYAVAGALIAAATSWGSHFVLRGGAGAWSAWLTLWAMAHAAALALGLFMLWQGRQPAWLSRIGAAVTTAGPQPLRWRRSVQGGASPSLLGLGAGLGWVMLPCGLLQSALVVAALAPGAATGAAAMAAFSLASAPGLLVGPAVLAGLRRRAGAARWQIRLTRLSGLMLSAASLWALAHGLWTHVREVC